MFKIIQKQQKINITIFEFELHFILMKAQFKENLLEISFPYIILRFMKILKKMTKNINKKKRFSFIIL